LPDEAREATEAYREEMDVLGGFIAERCIVDTRMPSLLSRRSMRPPGRTRPASAP